MDRYLHRLPRRHVPATRKVRSHAFRALPSISVLAIVGLFAGTGLVAAEMTQLIARIADERVLPSHGTSCASASVEGLAGSGVRGRARLCPGDGDITWRLDIEHLIGGRVYAGWLASFRNAEQCRFGALSHYVPGFGQPCTLADLGLPDAQPQLQLLAETTADAGGTARLDGRLGDARVQPQARAWMLIAPGSLTHSTPAAADWLARAAFDSW